MGALCCVLFAGLLVRHQLRAAQWRKAHQPPAYPMKLYHGNRLQRTIALTFDDGPHPKFTPHLLAVLNQYHVRATFFVVGKMAERYPLLVRAEAAAGHDIGNHTYDHVNLAHQTPAVIDAEWARCSDVLRRELGRAPHFCRPPGGDIDSAVVQSAFRHGMRTVMWTSDPGDFARPTPEVIYQRLLKRVSNGGIILLHDGIPETVAILPRFIEELRAEGYTFVTLSEMEQTGFNL